MIDHRSLADVLLGADVRLELALAGIDDQFVTIKNMVSG
jgi:hypothetical protein